VQLTERVGDHALLLEGRLFRLWDLLELGDVTGARREFDACERLAEQLRQPYHRWLVAIVRVLLALAEGRLPEVEALAQQALQIGQEAQNQNATLVFGVEMLILFRDQGRLEEMEPLLMSFAGIYPLILPNLRCALTLTHCDQGRAAEARSEFEDLAAHDFADLPRNLAWLFSVTYLCEICAFLGDTGRAPTLYALLLPFAGRNVAVGPVLAFGSAARYLGLLAVTLGDREQAARHFEDALAMNTRMGTRQALARTAVEYADMLLARGEPGDRARALELLGRALDIARELGMKPVVEQALALKLRLQGVPGGDHRTSIDAVIALVERERPDLVPHTAPDGTVTILFSDIEGSTGMFERLGDRRAQEILRMHNRIVREQVAAHGGFEVKSQGDGFMIAFQSARRALRCAIAVQRAFAAHAERHPEEPIRVRMGLHTGEAIKEADDFFGKAVILAARIAAQARGSEILVSSLFRELTESAGEVSFGETREVELKGLTGTRRVSAVAWQPTPALA